jgi:putative ABC transport system substrate-binding protein
LKRREFITLLGNAAVWPRVARGQFNPAVIGVLGSGFAQSSAFLIDALKEGMNENGLAEGRDYVLDVRWAEGDYTRFAALAFELLERKSSVIIVTTIAAARAAQQVAPATPIVMTGLIDPVGAGLIASLARPGNNTTGVSNMIQDMSAKGLELIREVAPTAKTIAALFNPNNPGSRLILEDVRSQAAKLGMTIQPIEFKGSAVLDATLEAAAGRDALLVGRLCAPRPSRTHRRAGITTSAADIFINSRVHRRRRVGRVRPLPAGQLPTCRDLREEGA